VANQLLSNELLKTIPKLYETEHLPPDQVKVPIKFFNPVGRQSWYITEIAEDGDIAFGFCNLGDDTNAELGYISIRELESIELPLGLSIERDFHWDVDTKLEDVIKFKTR
jgi:hypothetical protein